MARQHRRHSESTVSSSTLAESSADESRDISARERSRIKRLFFKNEGRLRRNGNSSGDADVSGVDNDRDVTPGSVEVWLDLPDTIKFDPLFSPFKHLYEQQYGTLELPTPNTEEDSIATPSSEGGDRTIFTKKQSALHTVEEVSPGPTPTAATGLIEEHHRRNDVECDGSKNSKTQKQKKLDKVTRALKLSSLIAGWLFLTVALLLNTEREDVVLHTAVNSVSVKGYVLSSASSKVLVKLTGPFQPVNEGNVTTKPSYLYVWLNRNGANSSARWDQNSTIWTIKLADEDKIDFAPSETQSIILGLPVPSSSAVSVLTGFNSSGRSHGLKEEKYRRHVRNIEGSNNEKDSAVYLRMHTTSGSVVPITLSYQLDPLDQESGIIYAAILLCSLYFLIIFEIVNRTLAALLSSSLSIAVLALGGARPTLPELISWLDVETLLLLFSMMVLVAILAETGLFDYFAVLAFEPIPPCKARCHTRLLPSCTLLAILSWTENTAVTGGRTWPLINCLCFFTAVMSTFLDNVTTVLLMTPITIRLCEVMQLNPVPILMSMVIYSNVGGAATPVGDPPNVIIASNPAVIQANINFTTFTFHMIVGILLVSLQTYFQLRFMFRDMSSLRHSEPKDIRDLRQELDTWRRAAASLASYSKDEELVRRALHKKVARLNATLNERLAGGSVASNDPNYSATLATMKQKYRIRDRELLIKATVCVTFVVVVFFLHAIPVLQRLSLGWTALLGALLLLLLAERDDLEPILARVEWSTLLFFAALFVLMEALSKLGLIAWIGSLTESFILSVGEESRLAVAILLVLWVSGLASAFVDNIPLTTMMIRVTVALGDPAGLALPLQPLIWALSFGACLGGNGTLIGASANVVCAGVAEQHGYRFTFLQFLRIGFPVMIGNLIVASIYLLFAHCVFTWH